MDKNKKSIIIGIIVLVLVTLLLLGLTYAYYRTRIVGNENDKSISVMSKKLEIVYSDNSSIITVKDIEPGYSNENEPKEFTVTNTGNEAVRYSIKLEDINNTFIRTYDWSYEVIDVTNGNITIASGMFPDTNAFYMVNSVEIPANETNDNAITYKLIIRYDDANEDQSTDMGKSLSFKINIAEEIGEVFRMARSGTLLKAIADDNVLSEALTKPGEISVSSYIDTLTRIKVDSSELDAELTYVTGYDLINDEFVVNGEQTCPYSECYAYLAGKYLYVSSTELMLIKNATSDGTIDFYFLTPDNVNDKRETLLVTTEDDYGTSYYFRGNVDNNYLNYSGMCWRIVRIQGNGIIKIILADKNYECNEDGYGTIDDRAYETTDTLLTQLDDSNLIDAEWCVDDSVYSSWSDEDGYMFNTTYNGYKRIITDKKPTLKCDWGATKKIGKINSITADEAMYSGLGVNSAYSSYLLQDGGSFYTLTPDNLTEEKFYRLIVDNLSVTTEEYLKFYNTRPAVTLKSDVMATTNSDTTTYGNVGTKTNPYVIS